MKWKNRSIGHPKSFFELVIAGFSLVALPLIIAFITGAFFVDKLTRQSEESVYRAVQATQNTRVLLRQIAGMERSIRQYFVLGDPLFYESYLSRHEAYEKTAIELEPLLLDLNLKDRLNILNQLEINLYQRLNKSNKSPKSLNVDAQEFIALTEAAQALLRDSNAVIDAEMTMMQNISRQARNIIFWELLAVIPGVIIFIVVFVVLLSRPIRQIDMAIKKIGAGDFDEEVKVTGPRDLEYLGERINWLRTRLKYLEEKKSKFLHYVSHELKTPLTAVRESAELLSEGVTGPLSSHQKEVTDILKKNSIDLQKMIEKLLSFNMPGDDQNKAAWMKLNLREIIETVIADHKPVIIAKKIDLRMQVSDIFILGDEEQFRVVIDNLLSNAVKFTPENGQVVFKARQEGENILIDISDTGPGIDPEEAEDIFEAFYQGNKQGKGLIQGSGLGLSIVREFVQAHQGSIAVINDEHKGGAHFQVKLPSHDKEKDLAWAV